MHQLHTQSLHAAAQRWEIMETFRRCYYYPLLSFSSLQTCHYDLGPPEASSQSSFHRGVLTSSPSSQTQKTRLLAKAESTTGAEPTAPQSSLSVIARVNTAVPTVDRISNSHNGGHDSLLSRALWSIDIVGSLREGGRPRRTSRQGARSLRDRTRCRDRSTEQSGAT